MSESAQRVNKIKWQHIVSHGSRQEISWKMLLASLCIKIERRHITAPFVLTMTNDYELSYVLFHFEHFTQHENMVHRGTFYYLQTFGKANLS